MFKVIKLKKIIFWLIVIIIILNAKNITKLFYPVNYQPIVYDCCNEYSLDPSLVNAVIKAESNFNTYAESNKNAYGLMQITKSTAEWIAQKTNSPELCENLFVPENNIRMGCFYLDYLIKIYDGNIKNALCAYNAGPGVVDRWLKDSTYSQDGVNLTKIPYRETELYVTKVLNNRRIYDYLYKAE